MAIVDDISVRKWTDENLLRIRAGIEGCSEAIAVADAEGRHVYHNRAFGQMFGYAAAELSEPLATIALYADQAAGRAIFETMMHGQSWRGEVEMAAKDGRRFPVELRADAILDERGQVISLIGVHTDITERKAAERRLRQLSRAVEQTASSVVITDLRGNITYANPKVVETTGYGLEEVLGKNPRMFKSGSVPAATYVELWRTISTGKTWRGEFQNKKKSGELYWEQATISPVADEHGVISHFVAVKEDITEQKAAREALARLEGQLRQSQKMEAVGQLAGGIAHDFNNMLAVIRGNAELLLMDADQFSPASNQGLTDIVGASERAANLTRQLLIFSRKQTMQSQPLMLNDSIRNLSKMLMRTIREDIRLDCVYAVDLPHVQADLGMIEQVLLNLVVNARDAMPQGGRVRIATEKLTLDAAQAQANPEARAGEFVCLSVSDTGTGIAPELLQRIFEPFFTTKEEGKGSGLGLPMVYGIVKQHQGWVEVASRVGEGTTFKMFFPAIPSPAKETAALEVGTELHGGTETILLVEDDHLVRTAVRRILETLHYKVYEAECAEEALEVWGQHAGEIALLLTDMVMPKGVTGRDLAERLHAQDPRLKIVLMSAYSTEVAGKHTEFVRKTKSNLLQKPFSTDTLIRMVRQCLDEK